MVRCLEDSPPWATRAIAGGFVPIPARQLLHAWRACRVRPLGTPDFRAYLACRELAARRQLHLPGEGRAPSFTFAELARLLGVADRRARASVGRLVADGLLEWSGSAIAFPSPAPGADDGPLADTIGRGRGDLVVPRRLLRFLARGARPALVAAALGLLLRCLSRRKGGFDGRGRAKASWIARAFGVDARGVKAARRELIALGWVAHEPSAQAAENRWGRAYRIDLGWAGPPAPTRGDAVPPGCRESPPPPAPGCRESPPPLINQDPFQEGIRNQEPAPGGPAGVEVARRGGGGKTTPTALGPSAKTELPSPRLANVRPEDLRDTSRMLELYRQAMARGLVGSSEADRLKFMAAAEHARAVGTVNPGGLFARLVCRGWWHFATQGDEEAASRRLKRHLYGDRVEGVVRPGVLPRSPSSGGAALSPDAALVREVLAAMSRAGSRADPFPLVRARDLSWTRERWDGASAELEGAAPAAIVRRPPSGAASRPIRARPGVP